MYSRRFLQLHASEAHFTWSETPTLRSQQEKVRLFPYVRSHVLCSFSNRWVWVMWLAERGHSKNDCNCARSAASIQIYFRVENFCLAVNWHQPSHISSCIFNWGGDCYRCHSPSRIDATVCHAWGGIQQTELKGVVLCYSSETVLVEAESLLTPGRPLSRN